MRYNMCIFCNIPTNEAFLENLLAVARWDKFPVNEGHVLIIPKRHVESYFDLEAYEISAMNELANITKRVIDEKFSPTGYNIGFNVGEAAGQTINHVHMHLIPRYDGDVENPKGGIRNLKKALVEY